MHRMKLVGLSPHSAMSTGRTLGLKHYMKNSDIISAISIDLGAGATTTWSG